jgi:hypothetical protein
LWQECRTPLAVANGRTDPARWHGLSAGRDQEGAAQQQQRGGGRGGGQGRGETGLREQESGQDEEER